MNWIKCSERMPEDKVPVLCAFRRGRVRRMAIGDFDSKNTGSSAVRTAGWFFPYPYPGGSPDYWMPLPEPPK